MNECCLFPKATPCFVALGRNGDLCQLLPAFHEVFRRTGKRPVVIVAKDYAGMLDGSSYVQPHVLNVGWYDGIPQARQVAEAIYGGGRVVQWWNDTPDKIELIDGIGKHGHIVLQSHGRNWGVNIQKHPNYTLSMWSRAGFTSGDYMRLPLVFDRRNRQREQDLVARFNRGKPLLLVNFTGVSSPFPFVPEYMNRLSAFAKDFNIVNLGQIQCHRPYDLLGLYDSAAGLITSDTLTAHLAPASKVPTVWCTVAGWTSSVPKGNVACHVKYPDAKRRLEEVMAVVDSWRHNAPRIQQLSVAHA